ncbi:hypothetical protein ABPG74_017604 [Tetrahymena malaccensis]
MFENRLELEEGLNKVFQSDYQKLDQIEFYKCVQAIQILCKQRNQVKIKQITSMLCYICQRFINQDDKEQRQISKLDCNCNNYCHKLCLKKLILEKKDEFESLQKIFMVINTDIKCKQCGSSDIYSFSIIKQMLSDKEIKILEFNYFEALKQKTICEQKAFESNNKNQVIEFECAICSEDLDLNTNGYILQCGCQFCRDCLKQHIDFLFKNNQNLELESIFCPTVNCKKVLNFEDISFILKDDKQMIEKLEQKNIISMFEKMKRENPESLEVLIVCPGKYKIQKESGQIIYIPQDQLDKERQGKAKIPLLENESIQDCNLTFIQERTQQKLFHKCSKCKYEFCLNNCDSLHENSCSDYQRWKIENNKDYRKELEAQGFRFCPNQNCCVITQRIYGCNRITCTMCNISYCFVCYFQAQTANEVYTHMVQQGH